MSIQRISTVNSTNNSNSPNFKGFVDKSLKKVVFKTLRSYCEHEVDVANSLGTKVDKDHLAKMVDKTKWAMQKLDGFMAKCHPKTSIFYTGNNKQPFVIKNPSITKKTVRFDKNVFSSQPTQLMRINLDPPSDFGDSLFFDSSLKNFSFFVDQFTDLVTPKVVDELLLDGLEREFIISLDKTNLIGKLRSRLLASRLKKLSAQCGSDKYLNLDTCIQEIEENIRKARLVTKANKEIKAENQRIIDELLNK